MKLSYEDGLVIMKLKWHEKRELICVCFIICIEEKKWVL